jgi:ribosomal protein S18 acetylase RimI-like enzyme
VSDLERAFAFMARGDIAGARREPFAYGTAVYDDELPLRHDSNYLLVEQPVDDPGALASDAERLQREAGLGHSMLLFPDAEEAARLAPQLSPLGYRHDRFLVMVQRRAPEREVDTRLAVEVGEEALREVRRREIVAEPWGSPDVADQLVAAITRIPIDARFYAVVADGAIVSHTDLYLDAGKAQVEAVTTDPRYRGRGYASAVVLRAVEEARSAGGTFVFLVASADDWPRVLYRRLGFDDAGEYGKLLRVGAPAPA